MKDELIHLLQRGRDETRAFVASLSPEECGAEGTVDHWAAKDIINHSTAWAALLVSNLEAAGRGDPIAVYDDYLSHNDRMFEQFKERSWEETLHLLETTWDDLIAFVEATMEDDLQVTDRLSTQNGRPLWRMLSGTAFEHPVMHLAYYQIEMGYPARAVALYEKASHLLEPLDSSDTWQGLVRYNRACIYALGGERDKALADLKEGLRLNPQLVEWSKQDPDLLPLHDDPAYEAIYA